MAAQNLQLVTKTGSDIEEDWAFFTIKQPI